jgi:hypothetical protein
MLHIRCSTPTAAAKVFHVLDADAESLFVEVWNENVAMDDLIGCVEIDVSHEYFGNGQKKWFDLDTGGQIQLCIQGKVFENPAPKLFGTKVERAEGIKDLSTFGEMNPFVKVTLLDAKTKDRLDECSADSQVIERGGVSPSWGGEMLSIRYPSEEFEPQVVLVEVVDKGVAIDSVIGQAEIDLNAGEEWKQKGHILKLDTGMQG